MTIVPLSILDHVFASDAFDPIQIVLEYGAKLDAGRLEECFPAIASQFTGVNGALVRVDERTLGLDLSQERACVRVVSAAADTPPAECAEPLTTELGAPLARARITLLGEHKSVLALALSHVVADGYGYFLLLSAWAARVRGQPFPPALCERGRLAPPADLALSASVQTGKLLHSGFMLAGGEARPRLRVSERCVPLSELATRAASVSSSDLLSARLWKEAMASEALPETTFTYPVDVRKWRPYLGPLFFGNASLLASATVPTSRLREAPTEEVASWIRRAVEEVPSQIDAALAELAALRAEHGLAVLPRFRTVRSEAGFVVSNLSKIPLSALDFGAGSPVALHAPADPAPRERSCAVFPARDALRLLTAAPG
jgi:hypothetical protein